jgi:hypothetical protein
VSYVYELPVGKGKAVGSNMGAVSNAILGGWQVTGITSVKDGFPLSIGTTINNACASFGCNQRPNITGNPSIRKPSIYSWFNTQAFAQPAAYTFGNAPRYMSYLRAPGLAEWDIGIQKWWNFAEAARLQLRAEMFNAFNRVNLYAPNQTYGSPGFGTITGALPARDVQMALKLYW